MLTALNINEQKSNNFFIMVLELIKGNSIKTELRSLGGKQLKFVVYTSRNGKIDWKKIDKSIGAQRNRILCNEKLKLPTNMGYKRFEGNEYKERLCTNVAVSLLCSIKNSDIKVGLFDKQAKHVQLVKYLLKYTDKLVVVSDTTSEYVQVADVLLEETGIPIQLSKKSSMLCDCDLVIAPQGLDQYAQVKSDAVVLSTKKSNVKEDCTLVYDYYIDPPDAVSALCPIWLDKTYFASALYTVAGIYQLGCEVASMCKSDTGIHTISSLKAKLINLFDKT